VLELDALVALAPGDGRVNALVPQVCGTASGLAPLAAEISVDGPESAVDAEGQAVFG
jgi:hypothetical protein